MKALPADARFLEPSSGKGETGPYGECSDRELFYSLLHLEHYPQALPAAFGRLRAWLERADETASRKDPSANDLISLRAENLSPRQSRALLLHYSPCGLLDYCWLEGVSNASINHTEVAALLFRILLSARERRAAYRRLLQSAVPTLPDVRAWSFCRQPEIVDEAFQAAWIRLCLGCFPTVFLGELIGFTQAHFHRRGPLDGLLHRNADEAPDSDLRSLENYADEAAASFLAQAENASERSDRELRIRRGYALSALLDEALFQRLWEKVVRTEIAEEVAVLVGRKAPYAAGLHKKLELNGKRFDHWFRADPFLPHEFLKALAQSPYLDRQHPEKSRLLEAMGSEGRMCGVFSDEERRLLLAWIDAGTPLPSRLTAPAIEAHRCAGPEKHPSPKPADERPLDRRALYHHLINSDLHPDIFTSARRLVERELRWARLETLRKRNRGLGYFDYDPALFESRIEALYRAEIERYRPFTPPPKLSREAYRFGIEQFAPAILVDGCWLQNIARDRTGDEVTERLFRIFGDEIGNGRCRDNHGNVYRELLAQLDIALPEITTPEFSRHRGFLDRAFDLPNYLLAISLFPETYLPEIIGLNLAIELSGLGAVYMRLTDEMEYWGIDSRIVRLHLSIDNMENGHAALARQAVVLHLEQIRARGGKDDRDAHWKRILTGYRSLRTVLRPFLWQLALHYFFRFMIGSSRFKPRRI